MSIRGKSVHILTPMYGGSLSSNYHDSILRLQVQASKFGVPVSFGHVYNESLISRARNRLADVYLKCGDDRTHALFIDSDIGFHAEDVMSMLELDLDICAAGCSKKSLRWDRLKAILQAGHDLNAQEMARVVGDFVFNFEHFDGQQEMNVGQPMEVKHLGTGMMMVRRNVFEKFIEAYPHRWYEGRGDPQNQCGPQHDFFRVGVNDLTREYDSEDFWFCMDAKAIGFKIWLCPWIRTTHKGSYDFIGDIPTVAALNGTI